MTLFLIYLSSLFCTLVLAQESQKVPTIQDEIFSFTQNGRVPLQHVRGVPVLKFSLGTPKDGTSKQEFVGIFDTSSPVSWVMSANCSSSACAAVPDNEKFRSQDSSTNYQFPFSINLTYFEGTRVQLKPELDVMQFEDFPFPSHLVAEALQVDYPKGYLPPANARLGMGGFGGIDWTKAASNIDPVEAPAADAPTADAPAANAPAADAPTANAPAADATADGAPSTEQPAAGGLRRAIGDDRFSTGATSAPSFRKRGPMGSAITPFAWIFGVDESLYTGSITQLPLAPITGLSSPFWNIPLSGFRFNTNQNQTSSFQLQSDAYGQIYSSSPALIVPKSIADDMNKALGAVYNETLNLYTISCSAYDTAPKLIFEFGAGTDAEIPSQQYIYKLEDDTQSAYANQNVCYTAISGGGDDKNVFLGGPFFRSFYLTYEFTNKAVGIAESIAKIGKVYPHASAY